MNTAKLEKTLTRFEKDFGILSKKLEQKKEENHKSLEDLRKKINILRSSISSYKRRLEKE